MSSSPFLRLDDIVALFVKWMGLIKRNNLTKATECFARAEAQAEQLTGSKDNFISACLKAIRGSAVLHHCEWPFMSSGDRATFKKALLAELLAIISSFQRRRATGTLLRGTELECAFSDVCTPSRPSTQLMSGAEAFPGFVAFMMSATNVLQFAVAGLVQPDPVSVPMTVVEAQLLFDFVADALDLIGQTVAPNGSPLLFVGPAGTAVVPAFIFEAYLVRTVSQHERDFPIMRGELPQVMHRFEEAWQRLLASPVFRVRKFADGIRDADVVGMLSNASLAEDLQRRGLRRCQLPACGKMEVHPSQFKHCSGCSAADVVYCCREHQVADWPSHKVACKAARKEQGGEKERSCGGALGGKKKKKLLSGGGGGGGGIVSSFAASRGL